MSSQAPLRPSSATQWPAMPQPPCPVARPSVVRLLEMSQLECRCSPWTAACFALLGFTQQSICTSLVVGQQQAHRQLGPLERQVFPGSLGQDLARNLATLSPHTAGGSYLQAALLPTAQAWHTPLRGRLCPPRSLLSAASRVPQHSGASAVP